MDLRLAAVPRHGKGRNVGGAPAAAFPGTWAPAWGRHRSSLLQQLGEPLLGRKPVGEIIRLQTTLTYSDQVVAEVCRSHGDSMKNRGESVEAVPS